MDSFALEAERIANILYLLDEHINYLSNIYKCPCDNCILSNTEKINALISYIITFYKFIIKHKTIIKQNNQYLTQIQNLLKNMIKFNNEIIKDILYTNIERSISIIYLEPKENNTIYNYVLPFQIADLIRYFPEYKLILDY